MVNGVRYGHGAEWNMNLCTRCHCQVMYMYVHNLLIHNESDMYMYTVVVQLTCVIAVLAVHCNHFVEIPTCMNCMQ